MLARAALAAVLAPLALVCWMSLSEDRRCGRSAAGLHQGAASGPSDSRRGLGKLSPRRRPCVLEK